MLFPIIQREAGRSQREAGKITKGSLRPNEVFAGRLFLMFCSCFEVDNDSKDNGNDSSSSHRR